MKILSRNGITGLVCLAISIWLLLLTRGLPPAVMVPIGPAFYPRVVLSLMAILSALLVVQDFIAMRRLPPATPGQSAKPSERPNYPLVAATFIIFGLYIAILPELGFSISTIVFVAGLQVALEWPGSWKRWLLVTMVAVGTTLICHVVFESYLSVLLPRGHWTGM